MPAHDELLINQTREWITKVVAGCNFCPFVARELKRDSIRYTVSDSTSRDETLQLFLHECMHLDAHPDTETILIIFSSGYQDFSGYLDLVALAERLLEKEGYEGIYQVASFHPDYRFAGSDEMDAANYTNRSPYPMLHLLREESIEKALEKYPHPEEIPERNIHFAREKGLVYMKMLRDACF